MIKSGWVRHLEDIAFQVLLIEYRRDCVATPKHYRLPLPPTKPNGRFDSIQAIERVGKSLSYAWREGHERICGFDWDCYVETMQSEGATEALKIGHQSRCQGDILWVLYPGRKPILCRVVGYPEQEKFMLIPALGKGRAIHKEMNSLCEPLDGSFQVLDVPMNGNMLRDKGTREGAIAFANQVLEDRYSGKLPVLDRVPFDKARIRHSECRHAIFNIEKSVRLLNSEPRLPQFDDPERLVEALEGCGDSVKRLYAQVKGQALGHPIIEYKGDKDE